MRANKYYIEKDNFYLDGDDQFGSPTTRKPTEIDPSLAARVPSSWSPHKPAVGFDSKAAALAKAESIGLDLSQIKVVRVSVKAEN